MKNRTFKKLPADKRQNILMRILRNKTDGLLYIKEEVALLSAGTRKKQFQIRTFNDINAFIKALDTTDELKREVIYGDMEMKKFKADKALIDSGIAVLVSPDPYTTGTGDQMLIYIPVTRRCKKQCVREKCICEHLVEAFGHGSVCCGLQLVQA